MANPFRIRREDGAAAVEMALVLPVLILLLFGIVWFGIALNRSQGMHAAAREGARVASVGENYADILAKVQNAQNQVDPADVEIQVTLGPNGVDGAVGPGETPCPSSRLGTVVNVRRASSPTHGPTMASRSPSCRAASTPTTARPPPSAASRRDRFMPRAKRSVRLAARIHREEDGATLVIVGVSLFMLLAAGVVSIDAGSLWMTRRNLIADTDSAALGAASVLSRAGCGASQAAGDEARTLLDLNSDSQTTFESLTVDGCSDDSGVVTVEARLPAPLFLAPIFGVEESRIFGSSTAEYGTITAMAGLRPIGICSQTDHYLEWIGYVHGGIAAYMALDGAPGHPSYDGAGVVHRLDFTTAELTSACNPNNLAGAGNWGWMDFDGEDHPQCSEEGNNGNGDSELRDRLETGYDCLVEIDAPGGTNADCDVTEDGPDDCPNAPGAQAATKLALDELICPAGVTATDDSCEILWIVVYDEIRGTGGGNGPGGAQDNGGGVGQNLAYHPIGFLPTVLRGFEKVTGKGNDPGYFDFEFLHPDDASAKGLIGKPPAPGIPLPTGTRLCDVNANPGDGSCHDGS